MLTVDSDNSGGHGDWQPIANFRKCHTTNKECGVEDGSAGCIDGGKVDFSFELEHYFQITVNVLHI